MPEHEVTRFQRSAGSRSGYTQLVARQHAAPVDLAGVGIVLVEPPVTDEPPPLRPEVVVEAAHEKVIRQRISDVGDITVRVSIDRSP